MKRHYKGSHGKKKHNRTWYSNHSKRWKRARKRIA